MRMPTRLAIALGVLVGALTAVVWSWAFTPLGRLDLQAAILARMASLQGTSEMEMTPVAREAANQMTRRMLGDLGAEGTVAFEDRAVPGQGGDIPVRIYTPDAPGPLLSSPLDFPSGRRSISGRHGHCH